MKSSKKVLIRKFLLVLLMLIAIIVCFTVVNERPTFADSGFSTSHSSGGHSFSSHSSGHSSYGGGSGSMSLEGFILMLVIYLIVYLIVKASNKKSATTPNFATKNQTEIENEIKKYIPDFNRDEFLNNGYNIYCDVQKAWMDFKLEDVKDVISNELYTMYESQLSTLEVKGEQNIMKDFVLRSASLSGVTNQNDTITIKTIYIIEFYDYIADSKTGKTIRGESKHKMNVVYEMSFRKSLNNNVKVEKCPNCGAEVDINTSGICPYCRTKLVNENTKWVLTDKKALNQRYI